MERIGMLWCVIHYSKSTSACQQFSVSPTQYFPLITLCDIMKEIPFSTFHSPHSEYFIFYSRPTNLSFQRSPRKSPGAKVYDVCTCTLDKCSVWVPVCRYPLQTPNARRNMCLRKLCQGNVSKSTLYARKPSTKVDTISTLTFVIFFPSRCQPNTRLSFC